MTKSHATIAVNATAARESGALTILRQFLAAAASYGVDDHFIVFVSEGINLAGGGDNMSLVKVDTRSWKERLAWDGKGFRKWLEANRIVPDVIVSLQNTGVNYYKTTPQIIYYHQLLPLEKFRWNPLKPSQCKYFFYKHFYPYFVRKYLDRVVAVVVQRENVKVLFSEKFGYDSNNISVFRPDMPEIDMSAVTSDRLHGDRIHFFYPATAFIYKNHRVLVDAVAILISKGYGDAFAIHLTGSENEFIPILKKFRHLNLKDSFVFEGAIRFEEVLSAYKSSSALLFPSYIETYGLPLAESMAFGLPIICSDLPYAHEVLEDYPGAEYVSYNDATQWADAIERRLNEPAKRYPHRETGGKGDWDKFIVLCRETAYRK